MECAHHFIIYPDAVCRNLATENQAEGKEVVTIVICREPKYSRINQVPVVFQDFKNKNSYEK